MSKKEEQVWVVETVLDDSTTFRNTFEGVEEVQVSLMGAKSKDYPEDRAMRFARGILSKGVTTKGDIVRSLYPPHRIKEVQVYVKAEV